MIALYQQLVQEWADNPWARLFAWILVVGIWVGFFAGLGIVIGLMTW